MTLNAPIIPLTADIAAQSGHIAWIEESDPVRAFQRMFENLQTAPVNAAVWANAGQTIDPRSISMLQDFRSRHDLELPHNSFLLDEVPSPKAEPIDSAISDFFNQLAAKNADCAGVDEACAFLDQHSRLRNAQLRAAIPMRTFTFNLRADHKAYTKNNPEPHADATLFGDFRILENLGCTGTCLLDNSLADIVTMVPQFVPVSGWDKPKKRYVLKEGANAVFWQVPENSVTLISNEFLSWQPILHAEAPTPPGAEKLPRTLLVHDFR